MLRLPAFPLRRWWPGEETALDDPAREPDGLTLLFSGIQGRSGLEAGMALGLADGGVTGRIAITDWTSGNPLRLLEHLRDETRFAAEATAAAHRVAAFRAAHPTAAVHLIGYSGGGYVALRTLAALPPGVRVTAAALVAPACSPYLDPRPFAAHTERGLASFRSGLDWPVLGMVTTVFGTCDGWHCPAAGMVGFHPSGLPPEPVPLTNDSRFAEFRFGTDWLRRFHHGGHTGYANRIWAAEVLGGWLMSADPCDGVGG